MLVRAFCDGFGVCLAMSCVGLMKTGPLSMGWPDLVGVS